MRLSPELAKILGLYKKPREAPLLSAQGIFNNLLQAYPTLARWLKALPATPTLQSDGRPLVYLIEGISARDSAVREIITSGHLAKFLLRAEVFEATANYNLMALPHKVIDEISLAERQRLFEKERSFHVPTSESEIRLAERILAREKELDDQDGSP